MKPKLYTASELSIEDYHSEEEHTSSSVLKPMLKSAQHYLLKANGESERDTAALSFGRLLHAAVLEPETFEANYAIVPKVNRTTKVGKAAYAKFIEDNQGKHLFMSEDETMLARLRRNLATNPLAHKLLCMGVAETSIFWVDPETGIPLKVRPDLLVHIDGRVIYVSLKSAADASKEAFRKDIDNYDYHFIEAMYADGIYQAYGVYPEIWWLVIEKGTYQLCLYKPNEITMSIGHELYREALNDLKAARESNSFASYQNGEQVEEISLPEYALRKYQQRSAALSR